MFSLLNRILQCMKEHPLPLSVAANFVLIVLVVMVQMGWSFSYEGGRLEIRQAREVQDLVKALFKDEATQLQARSLLKAQGYYQISKTYVETEGILRALGELDAGDSLVNGLRELSHKNKMPFEARKRMVTLATSPLVVRGEATICDDDRDELQSKFIAFFTPDSRNGMYVEATRIRPCSGQRNLVEVNPTDWRTLQLSGTTADADARVYLHRPYERRADESSVMASIGG